MRAIVCSGMLLLAACGPRGAYIHTVEHSEVIADAHDAQWFTRMIMSGAHVEAVELVYCPIQPEAALRCRTSVIWRADHSALADTPAAPATPAPAPAPPPEPVIEQAPIEPEAPAAPE